MGQILFRMRAFVMMSFFILWNWPTPKIKGLCATFYRTTYPAHWDSNRAKPAQRGSPGFAERPGYNPAATLLPVVDPRTQTGPNLGRFSNPPFGAGGNLMRNKFFGPGINNWDTALQKTTRISERMSVQFNQPGNLTSDPGKFGQSTGEVTRPDGTSGARQLQFGLKFQF